MPSVVPFRVLAVSDRGGVAGGDLATWAAALAGAGVEAVQLREKDLSDRAVWALATRVRAAMAPPARLLVNGRPDLALAAGADGVHLPADGLPTAAVRERWRGELLVGRSTHTPDEVAAAVRGGADYVVFGPVFASPGKGSAVGLEALAAVTALGVPVLALGGVGVAELPAVAAAGAAGVAGIRAFRDPAEAAELVAAAREAFDA